MYSVYLLGFNGFNFVTGGLHVDVPSLVDSCSEQPLFVAHSFSLITITYAKRVVLVGDTLPFTNNASCPKASFDVSESITKCIARTTNEDRPLVYVLLTSSTLVVLKKASARQPKRSRTETIMDGFESVACLSVCIDFALSDAFCAASFADGSVLCWPIDNPQLKTTVNIDAVPPPVMATIAAGSVHFVAISAASDSQLVGSTSSNLYSWRVGRSPAAHGQLGRPDAVYGLSQDHAQPVDALWGVPIAAVAPGPFHTAASSIDGSAYSFGATTAGTTSSTSTSVARKSTDLAELLVYDLDVSNNASSVACGSNHSVFVSADHQSIHGCGSNKHAQLGRADSCDCLKKMLFVDDIPGISNGKFVAVYAGGWNTIIVVSHSC